MCRGVYAVRMLFVLSLDSQYFSHVSFSSMQAKMKISEQYKGCIVTGDLNARFGNAVRELPVCTDTSVSHFLCADIPDPMQVANDNANAILGICVEGKMVILNNKVW